MRIRDWSSDVCSSDLDSCGADTRFDTMFRSILSRIPLIYHKDTPPNSSEAEKGLTFDSRLPNGPVSAREASDLLTEVTGTRLLILLADYARLEDSCVTHHPAGLTNQLRAALHTGEYLPAAGYADLDLP